MDIAQEMLTTFNDYLELFKKVITGNKSWLYCYNIETKAQSSQWKRPEEPCMFVCLFSLKVMTQYIMNSYNKVVRSIRNQYNLEDIPRLRKAFHQKCTEFWENQSQILHPDNTPAYTSMLVREFLAKNKTVIMPPPRYSSDLIPTEFVVFPKLKTPMNGKHFATIEEIKEKSKLEHLCQLLSIPKSAFQKRFEDLYLSGVTLKEKRQLLINKYFLKEFKVMVIVDHTSYIINAK